MRGQRGNTRKKRRLAARAVAYAEGGGSVPLELEMSWRIEDMGAGAILGEEVDARLIRRVSLASNVYRAFCSRRDYRDGDGSANWAEWSSRYPEASNLLAWAVSNE